jgi:hypothetical protein
MNQMPFVGLFEVEVRDVQPPHGAERHRQRFIGLTTPALLSPKLPQDSKNTRSIESLSFAVAAKVRHGLLYTASTAISKW